MSCVFVRSREKDHKGGDQERRGHVRKEAKSSRVKTNVTKHCDCVYLFISVLGLVFDLIIIPILQLEVPTEIEVKYQDWSRNIEIGVKNNGEPVCLIQEGSRGRRNSH